MPVRTRAEAPEREFDREAEGYDRAAVASMPRYDDLHQILLWGVPYISTRAIRVLELGCGTGTLTRRVLEAFPHAAVTAVDLSPQMLAQARRKLLRYRGRVEFLRAHLADLELAGPFDAVLSALAIHHLTDRERRRLFRRVHQWLPEGGYFGDADDHLPEDPVFDFRFREVAREFAPAAAGSRWSSPQALWHEHEAFDHPSTLFAELQQLRRSGFRHLDVPWRFFGQAVVWAYR